MPKNAASKSSTPSTTPRARTYAGSSRSARGTLGSSSSGAKNVIVSRPAQRLSQNVSTSLAPGKRPAIAMIAMGSLPLPVRREKRAFAIAVLASPRSTDASAAGVGLRKNAGTVRSPPSAATTRTACSELPPSSKKLSSRPIRSSSSSSRERGADARLDRIGRWRERRADVGTHAARCRQRARDRACRCR